MSVAQASEFHNYDDLTDKEKETLRLMVRGHDAKSMANTLSLSVHTINERLRSARRKLGVTSSREAARMVFELEEQPAAQNLADKELGDVPQPVDEEKEPAAGRMFADLHRTLIPGGIFMALISIAAVLALQAQTPDAQSVAAPTTQEENRSGQAVSAEMHERLESAEHAALAMLEMADSEGFELNSKSADQTDPNFAAWNALVDRRQEIGKALSRETHRIDIIEREGLDEWIVRFHTDFERLRSTYEKMTLGYDGAGFVIKDYEVE